MQNKNVIRGQEPKFNHARAKQVSELAQQYKSAVTLLNTYENQEFRVPLIIKSSTTPLDIKVSLFANFPVQAPVITILTQVIHPSIQPETQTYIGQTIKAWTPQSNLLSLLQLITDEFNNEPPISASLFDPGQQPRNTMTGNSAGLGQNPRPSEQRSEQQIREFATNACTSIVAQKEKLITDKLLAQVSTYSLSDLQRLNTYEEDRQHLVITYAEVIELQQTGERIEDEANDLAIQNKQMAQKLAPSDGNNAELELKMNQMKQTLARLEGLQSKLQKVELMKIMNNSANEAYKESNALMKSFVKSNNADVASFSKQYIESRAMYHKKQAQKEMLAQAQ